MKLIGSILGIKVYFRSHQKTRTTVIIVIRLLVVSILKLFNNESQHFGIYSNIVVMKTLIYFLFIEDVRKITPIHSTKENNQKDFTVHKILPGYAINVFDFKKSEIYETARKKLSRATRHSNHEGPFDPHAIRISFAKGWSNSQGYSRSDITNCPCWIEVHLVVPQTTQQGKKYQKN